MPADLAKIVSSLPIPAPSPGLNLVPRWRTMISPPVTVRVRDDYGGCRSWLEITRDLPFEGTPVLSDEEFERASEEIASIADSNGAPAYA